MERFNLFGQAAFATTLARMAQKLSGFFATYADPEYDLWKGGRSKARRHHAPEGRPDDREPRPRPWKPRVPKGVYLE